MINTREIASKLLQKIYKNQHLDKVCEEDQDFMRLDQRDKNFIRLTILETLRRNYQIDSIIKKFLKKPLNLKRDLIQNLLRIATCQILFLKISEYAVVNSSVEFAKKYNLHNLTNAILRNICRQKVKLLDEFKDLSNIPDWITSDLSKYLEAKDLQEISNTIIKQPELNIKIKKCLLDSRNWEETLNGKLVHSDVIITDTDGKIENKPFYKEGHWWIQGISSSLPVKCIEKIFYSYKPSEVKILEIGAAPGGKTAQLIDYGYQTVSLESSFDRSQKLKQNLERLNYKANVICQNFLDYKSKKKFNAVLLDAPCSASGLLQKKPEILISNKQLELENLIFKQEKLLSHASNFIDKNGYLVYCVCSIHSAEGSEQILKFLKFNENFSLITPDENIIKYGKLIQESMLLITPKRYSFFEDCSGFIDGFFIAILKKVENKS